MTATRRTGYSPQEIEPKWQRVWAERGVMKASDSSTRPKYYDLVMYPYPSGDLTVGHARNYVMGDVLARMKRMQGHEVLHPFGWDAFGLPAENAAMRRGGVHPGEWTLGNIKKGKRELEMLGMAHDSAHEAAMQSDQQAHEVGMQQAQQQAQQPQPGQQPQPQPAGGGTQQPSAAPQMPGGPPTGQTPGQ